MLFKLHLVKLVPSVFPHSVNTCNKVSRRYLWYGRILFGRILFGTFCLHTRNSMLIQHALWALKLQRTGLGMGGEKGGAHSSRYTQLQTNKCPGNICASPKPGCAHCLWTPVQTCCNKWNSNINIVATQQYYAPETGQVAANLLH